MAIPHARSGEPVSVGPLGPRLCEHVSSALFKADDLEVMRVVLPAGKALPEHEVPGECTLQCIEGRLRVDCDGLARELAAGELLFLGRGVRHGVLALQDASALVTIALKPDD